jgi:drug/metabolite transporter (DMT)-like permease
LLTRLGEAQILLPAALLIGAAMLRRAHTRPLATWWLLLLGIAVVLTAASKIAFIGWGVGVPELNFTGVSGHAMVSAGVYPVLFSTVAGQRTPTGRLLALIAGCLLAVCIAVSRVVLGAHSISEVVAGLLVGGMTSLLTLNRSESDRRLEAPVLGLLVAIWLGLMPMHAPASRTHATMTRLALWLSGHDTPYTRRDLLRRLQKHDLKTGLTGPQSARSG